MTHLRISRLRDRMVRDNLIEILAAEQSDGTLVVYHAMDLTRKMAVELGLV